MFKTIFVPFDGSAPSEHALRVAVDMAQKYDAALHVAFVPEPETTAIAMGSAAVEIPVNKEKLQRHIEEVQGKIRAQTEALGQAVTTDVLSGRPAEALLAHASKIGADLIVVGRRGLGTLPGLLMGSLSHKLIGVAPCPVMAVH